MAKLYDMDVEQFLFDSVQIDRNNVKGEFLQVSAQFAYWNERWAQAQRDFQLADLELKKLIASVHRTELDRLIDQAPEEEVGSGKNVRVKKKMPTAGDVDAAVSGRQDVQVQRGVLAEAEVESRRLYGVVQAIKTKKDMLMAYGSMVREEMRGDPTVREEMRERSSFEEEGGGGWKDRPHSS